MSPIRRNKANGYSGIDEPINAAAHHTRLSSYHIERAEFNFANNREANRKPNKYDRRGQLTSEKYGKLKTKLNCTPKKLSTCK